MGWIKDPNYETPGGVQGYDPASMRVADPADQPGAYVVLYGGLVESVYLATVGGAVEVPVARTIDLDGDDLCNMDVEDLADWLTISRRFEFTEVSAAVGNELDRREMERANRDPKEPDDPDWKHDEA